MYNEISSNTSLNPETPSFYSSVIEALFDRDTLAEALTIVGAAQIDAEIGWVQLEFTGNNKIIAVSLSHNMTIKYEFESPHKGSGFIKISGKQLSEYVRNLPPVSISLKAELPTHITLKCKGSSARIQLVQDFVEWKVDVPQGGTNVMLKGENLEEWCNTFRDFVSVDDYRFYANGALIWLENENDTSVQLSAVASDALRLAKSSITEGFEIENNDDSQVLVSKRAIDEMRRICGLRKNNQFQITWNSDGLFFSLRTKNYTMISKTIAGVYPPYEGAFPQQLNTTLSLDKQSFLEAVKRTNLFSDANKIITLKLKKDVISIASFTPGQKENEEILDLDEPVASSFEVNYNGSLVQGVLNALPSGKIHIAWEEPDRPAKITGEGTRAFKVFYLLVPARY